MRIIEKAIIFSIEEFSVYDGPGIRTTVFFKGCPLRCNWCHNPEGWEKKIQIVKNKNGCLHCRACDAVCEHKDNCVLCGKCISVCPKNLIRFSGEYYTSEELSKKLLKNIDYLNLCGGGVTFSGGECLMYADFICETAKMLEEKTNLAIETCGYCNSNQFKKVLENIDYVMYDLKLIDKEKAIKYTGKDNSLILKNFQILSDSGVPFVVRVPLIPGVTDTNENLTQIADIVEKSNAQRVELLPYNKMAGSKYKLVGLDFNPMYDEKKDLNINIKIFNDRNIKTKIM